MGKALTTIATVDGPSSGAIRIGARSHGESSAVSPASDPGRGSGIVWRYAGPGCSFMRYSTRYTRCRTGLLVGLAFAFLGLIVQSGNAAPLKCSRSRARSLERTLPAWRSYIKPYAAQGQVLCSDFTGDGKADIVFTSWGAMNHGAHYWSAFRRTSRSWERVAFKKDCCGRRVRFLGTGISIDHSGRTIIVREPIYRAKDPACCPTGGTREGRWRWRSGRLSLVRTSHT
jgi:hypothetical protein